MTGTSLTDTDFTVFAGMPLLRTIATAFVRLSRTRTPTEMVYEPAVQRAFNQTVLRCIELGADPPSSVPDLARWGWNMTLRDWPLDFTAADATGGERLVDPDTRTPTQHCLEWAMPVADAGTEQFENLLVGDAISSCRTARAPESYTAFRDLLTRKPVLTGIELAALTSQIELVPVTQAIRRSYEPASAALLRDGCFSECARCHCLRVPLRDGRWVCELDRCRRDGKTAAGRTLAAHEQGGVYQLRRPLRMFITSPGIAEIELEAKLRKWRLQPQMWPEFDAYDLRIVFPDGTKWAVDVKDRANPALLGRSARALPPRPSYDRGLLVVPAYRVTEREDYLRVFVRTVPPEVAGSVELMTDRQLLAEVKAIMRRLRADTDAGTTKRAMNTDTDGSDPDGEGDA